MRIIEFLKARVMEDGEFARLAMAQDPDLWTADHANDEEDPSAYLLNDGGMFTAYGVGYTHGPGQEHEAIVKHIVHNQPVRAWADHQAKLAIIAMYEEAQGNLDQGTGVATGSFWALGMVLRHLVVPYSNHPDFNPAWRI